MEQDWEPVVLRKHRANATGKPKTQTALNEAVRSGASIQTQKKFAAGSNKVTSAPNARLLDEETEASKHRAITHDFKIGLLKARQNKNLTQKQLAQLINEKPTVIAEYETGKAIPNGQIISKLNRALGVTLPKIPKSKPAKEEA